MRKLLTGFGRYSIGALIVRAQAIKAGLTAIAWCPAPWPAPYPSRADVLAAIDDFLGKAVLAEDGGKGEIAARDAARAVMEDLLTRAAPYIQGMAAGDVQKLEATGYEVSKVPASGGPGLPAAPDSVKMRQGDLSGSLILSSGASKGATAYEAQLGTDPNSDASYTMKQTVSGCRRIVFTGVTPGTIYYGRIRAIGRNGTGEWSDVVQLRAL